MKTIEITVGSSTSKIPIGRRGENEATEVVFDISSLIETYGDGTCTLMVRRPGEESAYPVAAARAGSSVTWTVSNTDTDKQGRGEAELFWYVGDALAKSAVYVIDIAKDIGISAETPPDPYETWLDTLTDLAADIQRDYSSLLDDVDDLKRAAEQGGTGLSAEAITAILNAFAHVAWIDEHGIDYYNAIAEAFHTLSSITATFTQGSATINDTDALSDLIPYLTVTASYDDGTTGIIPSTAYTLSGTLTAGTSTITVSYGGKTDTFIVTVSHQAGCYTIMNMLTNCSSNNPATSVEEDQSYSATITASSGYTLTGAAVSVTMGGTDITSTAYNAGVISVASVTGALGITVTAVAAVISSISAAYTQSGTVYETDNLDSLKQDLVVTAHYSDSSTSIVNMTDYSLSGTLVAGISAITVSYADKTAAFSVAVTAVDLDTVVYEGKSYRDIFETGSQIHGFDFENGLPSGVTVNAGTPSISTDDAYGGTHSVKAFGTSSQQYRTVNTTDAADWNKYQGKQYFAACKVKCTRYVKGWLGVDIASELKKQAVTNGWETLHSYFGGGQSIGQTYFGSGGAANLDGYVDDIVYVQITDLFTTVPGEFDMLQWYNEYCDLKKAGKT